MILLHSPAIGRRPDIQLADNWGSFTDINRDGAVDAKDLDFLVGEWLYDMNNANT